MDIKEQRLIVSQKVEGIEALTGFETRNKYQVLDSAKKELFYAYEESDGFLRFLLKSSRPLTMHVIDSSKSPQLAIRKRFAFFLPKYEVRGPDSSHLGTVRKAFTFFAKRMEVIDSQGHLLFTIKASLLHPWTMNVYRGSAEVAQIMKKWSGAGKEMFTDADNFLVDFGQVSDKRERELLFAAAFAVDLSYFERSR